MARLSIQQLAALFRRVGVGLQSGVDILRVWEMEQNRGSATHRLHMATVHDRLRAGDSLAKALAACGDYFPPMTLEMIGVGERTGHLEAVLLRLANHYDHLVKMRREFIQASYWPAVQLVAAILIVTLLIFIMGLMPGDTDLLGLGLKGLGGVVIFWFFLALVGAAVVAVVYSLARGWWGTTPITIAMRLPVLGPFLESMALSRFTWSFAVAVDVGMDARECMRLALRSTHNPVYMARIEQADQVLERHGEFHEALEATGVFREELIDAMRNADLAGTHAESMRFQAQQYDERFRAAAHTLALVAGGAIRAAVALILIALILRLAGIYLGAINDALEM